MQKIIYFVCLGSFGRCVCKCVFGCFFFDYYYAFGPVHVRARRHIWSRQWKKAIILIRRGMSQEAYNIIYMQAFTKWKNNLVYERKDDYLYGLQLCFWIEFEPAGQRTNENVCEYIVVFWLLFFSSSPHFIFHFYFVQHTLQRWAHSSLVWSGKQF